MNKCFTLLLLACIMLSILVIGSCAPPTPAPIPAPPPTLAPQLPISPPTQTPIPTPPPITQTASPTVPYTLKYYIKADDAKSAEEYWTFQPERTLLIHYKSPSIPFTIQKMTFLGWIFGNDSRNWNQQTFQLKIWNKYQDKQLWSDTYPYTLFNPTIAKWQEFKIPNIKVDENFSVEFIPDADYDKQIYSTRNYIVFKCGIGMGVDYNGQNANSDLADKGVILPWGDSWFKKHPRERLGWMIRIEGEGAPQK